MSKVIKECLDTSGLTNICMETYEINPSIAKTILRVIQVI